MSDKEYDFMHSRWRVGRFGATNRSIFVIDERKSPPVSRAFIGRMETIALAESVVITHNQALAKEEAYLSGPHKIIKSGESFHSHSRTMTLDGPLGVISKPPGVLEGPIPALFGMTHLKYGRDGSLVRRGLLDA